MAKFKKYQPIEPVDEGTIRFKVHAVLGNFRLWRERLSVGAGEHIAALCVASTDTTWKVQIPETSMMYQVLTELYRRKVVDNDKEAEEALLALINNCFLCTNIPTGHVHSFIQLVFAAYMNPEVLEKGFKGTKHIPSHKDFTRFARSIISEFIEFNKDFRIEELSDKEMERDEMAQAILDKLEDMEKKD